MHPFRTAFLFLFVLGTRGLFADANSTTISAAEYFVDNDPGEGNGTALTAQDGAFDSEVEAITPVDLNVTGLTVGPHLIGTRYKDDNNTWGEVLYQTIHVYDANPDANGSGGGGSSGGFATIKAAEYFVDTDPGEGNGTAFQAQDGAFDSEVESILPKDLNVTGLAVGPHLVGVRYQDNNNTWGEVLYQTIHVYDANPDINNGGSGGSGGTGGFTVIAGAEYFIGNDPGEGNATALQPKDGAFDSEVESTLTASLSLEGYAIGAYLVGVRYVDNNGTWGDVLFKTIEVDVDTDGDGLADKAEIYYETNSTVQDTDGDGYLDGEEVAFGSDPTDASSLGNRAPTDLNATTVLSILENQPIGTFITEFNATDTDANNTLTYSLADGNGSGSNPFFSLDPDGTLVSAVVFDYENNASSYSITVQAKDELNATNEGNFTVTLLNINSSTPLNDSSFISAINLWFSNQGVAKDNYGYISDWNVSGVTNMSNAFLNRSTFNEDIGNWDVSSVTEMESMFNGASDFNKSLNLWNTSNVKNLRAIFRDATAFNGNISDWNTSSVTNLFQAFHKAPSFNQDIINWDTSSVTNMAAIFWGASSFNQDIGDWNVSMIQSMQQMFSGAKNFDQDIGEWNTSNVTNMNKTFAGALNFNQDIGNWNVKKVTTLASMFEGATSFNQHIGDWNVSSVSLMSALFKSASSFNQDIGKWDVSNVVTMDDLFNGAVAFNQDIGDWNVSKVWKMTSMFRDAKVFNQDIGNWNISSVTEMGQMFHKTRNFDQDISGWNVSNVNNMSALFWDASAFNQNITDWNTSSVSNMNKIFDGTPALSNNNRGFIHLSFSLNENWPYEWSNLVPNRPPTDLNSTAVLGFQENQPIGTVIGEFNATDPDSDTITYYFASGENNNSLFTLDSNGTLKTATIFDYESNASSYTITVKAKDELNATTEGNFSIALTNVIEDFDQDGIEDAFDTDIDGDGYSNVIERAYPSDPRDPNSVADTLPTALTLSSLEIMENQPIGSVVGQFTVIDPDINDSHIVKFNDINDNISHNHLFTIDANNTLRTAVMFDYENNSSTLYLRVKAKQNQVGVFWEFFTLSLLDDSSDNEPTYQAPTGGYQTPDGNYSSPDSGYQSPDSEYQSPGGSSPIDDQNETKPQQTKEIFLPILQTLVAQTDGDGTHHLTGKILTDGGSPVFEAGFLVSKKISLSDPIRITATLESNATRYYASISDLSPNTTYYFRAYAINQEGQNLGALKKFHTALQIDSNTWYFRTKALPGGWRKSNWFGAFQPTEHQWIYHSGMGWLYPSTMEDSSLWLWNQADGWRWTQEGVYPYLFRWRDSAWIYLQGRISGRLIYYNYSTQSYE